MVHQIEYRMRLINKLTVTGALCGYSVVGMWIKQGIGGGGLLGRVVWQAEVAVREWERVTSWSGEDPQVLQGYRNTAKQMNVSVRMCRGKRNTYNSYNRWRKTLWNKTCQWWKSTRLERWQFWLITRYTDAHTCNLYATQSGHANPGGSAGPSNTTRSLVKSAQVCR